MSPPVEIILFSSLRFSSRPTFTMTQIKLPNKMRVGAIDYELLEIEMQDLGQFDNEDSIIRINSKVTDQQKYLTLLHEAIHAIMFEAGLGDYDNEVLVNIISSGMFTLLRDNKFMTEFFRKNG